MKLRRPLPALIQHAIARGWSSCGQVMEELIFPWSCLICGAEGIGWRGPFCPCCRAQSLASAITNAGRSCPRCAMPAGPHADLRGGCSLCRRHSLGFDRAIALGPYEGTIRELCLRLKQERDAWLAPWLGGLLAEARSIDLAQPPDDTWVVPVPLHWWRRLRRGYNQANALAEGLAGPLGLKVHQPLRRVRATDSLASLGAVDRVKAMRGAFVARPDPAIKGRTILLVDDILTTGATSGAAARALKKAGARRVIVVVLARTL